MIDWAIPLASTVVTGLLQNSNNKGTAKQNNKRTQQFLEEASAAIEEAAELAEYYISIGEDAAASAIIEGTKLGIGEVWKGVDLGEEKLREFVGYANQVLEPIVKQGRYASDEMASMLGIPGSDGKIVPFDSKKLSDTPGYKFREEWGRRTVENSAVGNYLSGQQARELTEFGQGLAGTYFDTRVDQLGGMAGRGDQAATAQAGNFMAAGQGLGSLYGNAGQVAGQLRSAEGLALAELFSQGGMNRANLTSSAASTLANLQLGGVTANNNADVSRANSTNSFLSDINTAITGLPALFGANNIPATNTISPIRPILNNNNGGSQNTVWGQRDFFEDV